MRGHLHHMLIYVSYQIHHELNVVMETVNFTPDHSQRLVQMQVLLLKLLHPFLSVTFLLL